MYFVRFFTLLFFFAQLFLFISIRKQKKKKRMVLTVYAKPEAKVAAYTTVTMVDILCVAGSLFFHGRVFFPQTLFSSTSTCPHFSHYVDRTADALDMRRQTRPSFQQQSYPVTIIGIFDWPVGVGVHVRVI